MSFGYFAFRLRLGVPLKSYKINYIIPNDLRLTYGSSDVPFQHRASEVGDVFFELQNVLGSATKRSDDCSRMLLSLSKV